MEMVEELDTPSSHACTPDYKNASSNLKPWPPGSFDRDHNRHLPWKCLVTGLGRLTGLGWSLIHRLICHMAASSNMEKKGMKGSPKRHDIH